MTFQPLVPASGLIGWNFLKRTQETQADAFQKSPQIQRDTDYFKANIGKIDSAEDLVNDRRLLRVALGAFGLDGDIDSKFLIKKILSDGTFDPDALANKFSDKRYFEMSKAFGFGDFATPLSKDSAFGDKIVEAYRTRQFEIAVGEKADDLRMALNLERELSELSEGSKSDDSKWFSVMGSPPLRQVFERAFGLPSSFAQLDLDRQLDVFRERSQKLFGDSEVAQFADPEKREKLVQRYLLMEQAQNFQAASSQSIALTLLQGGG